MRELISMRERYPWKNMFKTVKAVLSKCTNKPQRHTVEPLTITDTPQRPFDKISIDTVGPMPTSEGKNIYALTIMCDLTKYLIVSATPNEEAKTIARVIFENVILTKK